MAEYIAPAFGYNRSLGSPFELPQPFTKQDRAGSLLAILSSNEYLNPLQAAEIRISPAAPNGYLVGAGVGQMFRLLDLYPAGRQPKGIVCTDIMPEVVMVGRAFVKSLKKHNTWDSAVRAVRGPSSLPLYAAVIRDEKDPTIRKRLVKALPYVADWMRSGFGVVPDNAAQARLGTVLSAIRDHFPVLKSLAMEDKIDVTYASITDPSWIEYVQGLPDWSALRNVVYASNVLDHITGRGVHLEHMDTLNQAMSQLRGEDEHNWFADTTENRLRYEVRVAQEPPIYSQQDFIF